MNYDGAKGYLVGEENKGQAMFTMMNRLIRCRNAGVAQAEIAYQAALAYEKIGDKGEQFKVKPSQIKTLTQLLFIPMLEEISWSRNHLLKGQEALLLCCTFRQGKKRGDKSAEGIASLLISIKGYATDKGFEYTINAQQVFGGHGYIEEWGMSQYARDCRIAMIYEGTNGIQALI